MEDHMKPVLISFLIISFLTFGILLSQEKPKEPQEPNDSSRNLVIVEEVKPVPQEVKPGFESIDGEDGLAYLKFFSSDALEGRETASQGHQIAAEFVAALFESWGLKPAGDKPAPPSSRSRFPTPSRRKIPPTRSFLQQVELKEYMGSKGSAKVERREGSQYKAINFNPDIDYQYNSRENHILSASVVFVGYGISEKSIKFDDYKGIDVKGKIVMMLTETPKKGDKDSPFEKGELKSKYYPVRPSRRRRSPKTQTAMEKGAIAVLLVENSPQQNRDVAKRVLDSQKINDERPVLPGKRRRFSLTHGSTKRPWDTIPTIRVSRQMADQILDLAGQKLESLKMTIEKTMKPNSMILRSVTFTVESKNTVKLVKSPNVLGYIEGSDPELKKEVIVIGAHLDHLGKRGDYIFNGADDNGSGSVSVMAVARAISVNPGKPKRSVLFALWTGEENGLLGSRHYVSNPYFPLDKTIAYINLDMVSREWDKSRLKRMAGFMGTKIPDETLEKLDVTKFITLAYSADSLELHKAFKDNNEYVGISLMLRESKGTRRGGGGSDHASFGMKERSGASFFGAMTEDFHRPGDTYDKINVKLMQMTTRLVYLTAMTLSSQ
jgi:hypothetical protein